MQAQTVLDAYQQFRETEACQTNPRLLDNLRTALRRYVLPCYDGFAAKELQADLEGCLAQISLAQLLGDATQILERLEQGTVPNSGRSISRGTVTNYRSALLRFFNWMYTQGWEDPTIDSEIPKQAPSIYANQTLVKPRQRGRQLNASPYALREEELTAKLKEQLEQLQEFWTKPEALNPEENRLSKTTFMAYRDSILCILGWHRNVQAADLSSIDLLQAAELEQLKAFIDWGTYQRGNGIGWAINMTLAAIAVAKCLFSQKQVNGNFSFVKELQNYLHFLTEQYYSEALDKGDEEKKNEGTLTFEEGIQVVEHLKQCCAPRHKAGTTRSESAILKSWQRYLITALLIYSPLRQREIRELECQRSLFREQEGYWVRFPARFKTGGKSAIGREFLLPNLLTQDLDKWLKDLRSKIKTEHNFVFIRSGSGRVPESLGQPLTARDTSDLVSTAIHAATSVLFGTSKRGTPQIFQNSALAYLGQLGRPEPDRLAELTRGQLSSQLGRPEPDRLAELTRGQLSRKILNPTADSFTPAWDEYSSTKLPDLLINSFEEG